MSKEPELNGFIALLMHPWVGLPLSGAVAIIFDVNLWLVLAAYVAIFVFWIEQHNAAAAKWREKHDK